MTEFKAFSAECDQILKTANTRDVSCLVGCFYGKQTDNFFVRRK